VRNLLADTRDSVGIFALLVGQASSRGAIVRHCQRAATGATTASTLLAKRPLAIRSCRGLLAIDEPPSETLVIVTANRIVYTEHWLRRDGYAPRQFWNAGGAGTVSSTRERS